MELTCSMQFGCANKNISHDTDTFKELHGSKEKPLPLGEPRIKKYVGWEYEEIGRIVGVYHRCYQQMFEDNEQSPKQTLDRLVVRDIKGAHHVFYFDISGPVNEDREIMAQAYKDYEAGKPIDPKKKALILKALAFQKSGSRTFRF